MMCLMFFYEKAPFYRRSLKDGVSFLKGEWAYYDDLTKASPRFFPEA